MFDKTIACDVIHYYPATSVYYLSILCFTIFQQKVDETFSKFKKTCKEKESQFLEKKSLFNFFHDAQGILEWIQEKMGPATSKDDGKDLEDVEVDFSLSIKACFHVTDISAKINAGA